MSSTRRTATRLFVSYSHADREWLKRLQVHLAPIGAEYEVDLWDDTRIRAGDQWRQQIEESLDLAEIAVLLISADYLASEFVRSKELPQLLQSARDKGTLVVPILVGPSLFLHTPALAQFQAVNEPTATLIAASKADQESVFLRAAELVLGRVRTKSVMSSISYPVAESDGPEDFLSQRHWSKLVRIGDWFVDSNRRAAIGSGMHAYLLSSREYGDVPYVLHATVSFTNMSIHASRQSPSPNAGIVLGWTHDARNPRYHNILLTGESVLVERIGFSGEDSFRDFEHLTDPKPFELPGDRALAFTVRVGSSRIDVFVDDKRIHTMARPESVRGRVGIRPWRSTVELTRFVVSAETS